MEQYIMDEWQNDFVCKSCGKEKSAIVEKWNTNMGIVVIPKDDDSVTCCNGRMEMIE